MEKIQIGIIGGSGLYDASMMNNVSKVKVETVYGDPSDSFNISKINGKSVAFLSRHGKGHKIPPHELNFKANISGFENFGRACK